jgi:HEAT repeat protein
LKALEAIPALINLLSDDSPVQQPVCGEKASWKPEHQTDTTPGEMAAVALSQLAPQSVEPIIKAIKDSNVVTRANSAFALGLIRDERNVEPLIAATSDSESRVRAKAAWSLGLAGDNRAVEPLVGLLKDSDWQVRSQAAWALGLKGDDRAVSGLVGAVDQMEKSESGSGH